MTKINRIVMKGFKSFGNRIEMIFGDKYNVILGPNGSGKSNVMDALCFVLGKGSAKGMRAEKAANLIYDGGKIKNPAKQGEVHIYFDNKKKIFPTEEEEVKVSRVIRQTGQSLYKINDKKRTRQQILDLLNIANINPDGYNIILQGDIVRFVEMSTLERREIIDEIAGIGAYEEKKNKALNELAKVEQKLNEAEIILTERKTYLKELKKDRDEALKYKELNDRINQNKATYLNIQIKDKTAERDKFEAQIKKHQDEILKQQQEIDKLKKDVVDKKEAIKALTKEVEQKGEKEQVDMLKKIEQLKVEVATNKTRISSCENEITRVNTRKDQLVASLEEIKNKIKELNKEDEEADSSKQKAESMLQQIEAKIAAFKKKNKMEDAAGIDKEIEEIDRTSEEKQKEILSVREEQQNLVREKDKLEYQLAIMDERIKKVLEVEKEHKAEIEKLKQKQTEFRKVTLEVNKYLNEDSSLALQMSNAKTKLNSAREELAKLETQNIGIKEALSADLATTNILNQKNLGEIYGVVSQLGNVEAKYSLALEIAAGPKIKSIVVDSDKTAANCIKFLKKEKSGTATFLPLNRIRAVKDEPAIDEYLKINGVHGKALDLISYEPRFKNVFSYVFGNTIVVENIDTARRIGIGSARMATLDGDMAELSGAMHGGYREKTRGLKFQQREIIAKVNQLEKAVGDNETLVAILEKRKAENEEKIEKLRNFKAELEGDIIKSEKSLHLESDDLQATQDMKKELNKQQSDIEKNLIAVNTRITKINNELASLKIKKQDFKDRVMQLRNPRLIAELNTFEQKRAQLKEEIMKYDAATKNITMQIKNILEPEEENIQKIIKQHEKEEGIFRNEITDLKGKIKLQEKDLIEKEKGQKVFYSKFKELFAQRDKINESIQKIETNIIGIEERIRGNEQRMNLISIENARVKAEMAGLEEEFSRYRDVELFTNKPIEQIKKDIFEFEKIVQNIGNVNMRALEVYDSVEKEYENLMQKKETLIREKEEVLVMMNEIESRKKDMFMKSFDVINNNFKNMFGSLSTKGEAFLDMENPENPLEAGLGIKVRLTGKKFLDIRSLSGGEKTLTALAFIFAIQEHEPASFYVFDEVDAALDKRNSEKLSKLIKNYADKAQYIIISHNDGIITEADTLYGVSMDPQQHISKVVSLKI